MTQKRRSKVRPQTTPKPAPPPPIDDLMEAGIIRVVGPERVSADAVAEAYGYGMMPIERLSPEELVERYPDIHDSYAVEHGGVNPLFRPHPEEEGLRDTETRHTLNDWLPAVPLPTIDGDPFDDADPCSSPALAEAVVRGIIEEIETSPNVRDAIQKLAAADAESAPAYLKAMAREIDAQHERAEGLIASAIAPDLTLILGELWTVRLAKMADAAGQMPTQYLQTLLARAWTAMPRRSRGEG
jgi:hypothetical protein